MRVYLAALLVWVSLGASAQTARFSGAWFAIDYPADFTARGSLQSATRDGFESAFFTSPDGEVEFYVFSPQWSGEAKDIALQPGEKEASRQVSQGTQRTVTHWTIVARDNSYTRSYQETRSGASAHIVGVKYKSYKAYNRYKKQYLAFKASLEQYAD